MCRPDVQDSEPLSGDFGADEIGEEKARDEQSKTIPGFS